MSKTGLVTQSELLNEYGWTKSLINKFLPEPTLKRNPRSSSSPIKLWSEDAVKQAMETEDFKNAMARVKKRKESATKALDTKRNNMAHKADEFLNSIRIKILPDDELREQVVKAKQEWYYKNPVRSSDGEIYMIKDASGADESTMNRWIVNYIRHELIEYDSFTGENDGSVGFSEIYPEILEGIFKKISEAYPKYKNECERQAKSKF